MSVGRRRPFEAASWHTHDLPIYGRLARRGQSWQLSLLSSFFDFLHFIFWIYIYLYIYLKRKTKKQQQQSVSWVCHEERVKTRRITVTNFPFSFLFVSSCFRSLWIGWQRFWKPSGCFVLVGIQSQASTGSSLTADGVRWQVGRRDPAPSINASDKYLARHPANKSNSK